MKSFLNGFLSVFLTIATIILFISFSIDNVISSNISSILSKDAIKDYIINYIVEIFPDKYEEINNIESKLNENKTIDDITDEYCEILTDDIINDTTSDIRISKKLNNLISDIEKEANLSEEELEYLNSKITNDNFNNLYHLILEEVKNILKDNNLLKTSKYLISTTSQNILIMINILLTILLIIINKSFIKTLMNVGIDLIISGTTSFVIFPITIKYIENISSDILNTNININILNLLLPGFVLILVGLMCILINVIYYKIKEKK